jgi:hypothetical protein
MTNIFKKRLQETESKGLPTNPIELYQTCSYASGYEYLRGIQEEVLKAWEAVRDQRDVICKMNTGSGKTLTGLLMLYSKMVERNEPALYLCPDNQLTEQTLEQAALYGIPVCSFDPDKPGEMPLDFINSKAVLVCNFYKLFNGRSIFMKVGIKIGAIVIDDAHKCVDIARNQSALSLKREHPIVKRLFALFEPALRQQLKGSFARLQQGDPHVSMKVPYWAWLENQDQIIAIINEEVAKTEEARKGSKDYGSDDTGLKWRVIFDSLERYDCYIGGNHLEIVPIHVPYQFFRPFNEAAHRYILSATFEDDYDLIKDLGIAYDSIVKPIVPSDRKDVGKRLILSPTRFDAKITDNEMRDFITNYPKKKHNVVVLVPSRDQARNWEKKGATLVTSENMSEAIDQLQRSRGNFMVFANRYDGMDFKGDICRVLVVDGLPIHNTIQDHYAEIRLESLRAGRKAQIIEQGLGRAVRSGGDYCVVYLMGGDLLSFLGVEKHLQHFTPVTRAQVKLGLQLLDGEDKKDSLKTIFEVAEFGLKKDHKDWADLHTREMQKVSADALDERKLRRLRFAHIEQQALSQFRLRNYIPAAQVILREIVHNDQFSLTHGEKGWFYQFAAQLAFLGDPTESNKMQEKAALHSDHMLHPRLGHSYNKAVNKGAQASLVKRHVEEFERPQDILNHIQGLIDDLIYTPEKTAKSFEKALSDLGEFLGFASQTPDESYGDGPDVLWIGADGHALVMEAKSRRTNDEVSKADIAQLSQSELWFKERYGKDAAYTAVTLQPTNKKAENARVDGHKIIDRERMQLLHDNLLKLGTALQRTSTKAHSEERIQELLTACNLTPALIRSTYIKDIR